jgi:hypothetical protein
MTWEQTKMSDRDIHARGLLGLLLLASGLAGSGCTYIEIVDHYSLSSQQLQQYRELEIVDIEQRAQGNYRRIGLIRGLSCTRSPPQRASEADALDQLRLRASLAGAHAISPPTCSYSGGVDWNNNCWQSIICESELLVDQAREPVAAPLEAEPGLASSPD